jgi:phage shock protein PspC (stress-responsive transcriptional regulator)
MKKSISINLQGLLFHIEEDGYEVLRRYLTEVKQHFSAYAGHEEIVADIESRIAELFAARLTPAKQVITMEDVLAVTAQLGRVSEFELPEDDDAPAADPAQSRTTSNSGPTTGASAPNTDPAEPRRLFRDESNKKVAGVAAGLGHYFNVNPLWFRLGFVVLALFNTDLFGNLDSHLHINFGGISFLTYFVLWIVMPKRTGLPLAGGVDTRGPGAGRKLFRDTQAGSVGGVAAGLAWYLKLDVTLVRVLFVVLTLAGGSGILLYLILWVVVPEAKTLSDQLEMRGEDVTLANIASTASADPIGAGRARVVQDNLSSISSSVSPIFKFLFTLIGWFAGLIMLVIAVALLIAVGTALGIVLGAFPDSGWLQTGDIPPALLRNTLPTWTLVAGFVVVLIPALSLLLAAVRLFIKRAVLPASARLTFFGIWLIAIIGLSAGIGRLKTDFRDRATISRVQDLGQPSMPIMVLDALDHEDSDLLRPEHLTVVSADSGQSLELTVRIEARGRTEAAAREAAEQVEYSAERSDSIVTLPFTYRFKADATWRKQEVSLRLALPTAGVRYRLTDAFTGTLEREVFDHRYVYDGKLNQRLFTVQNGRFVLASGPEAPKDDSEEEFSENDENNIDLNINGERIHIDLNDDENDGFRLRQPAANAARRTWKLTNFKALDVNGAYQVRIRRGSEYRVSARGPQKALDNMDLRVSGETLEVSPKDRIRFSFWGRNSTREPLLIEIEMPEFNGFDANGSVQADIAGFDSDREISIDQSGASWVKLVSAKAPLRLDVSGACHTLLVGSTRRLTAELSGASELRARRLTATEATIDVSGASGASVNVTRDLKAEASGASHINYYGQPENLETNATGAAKIRRANGASEDTDENSDENDTSDDSDDDDSDESDAAFVPAPPAVPAAPAAPKPVVGI